jgi:hypothetical protein
MGGRAAAPNDAAETNVHDQREILAVPPAIQSHGQSFGRYPIGSWDSAVRAAAMHVASKRAICPLPVEKAIM